MNAPLFVIACGEVFVRVCAAAFLTGFCASNSGQSVWHKVCQLKRFHEIRVPDQRAVCDFEIILLVCNRRHLINALFERLGCTEHSRVSLHCLLHLKA